MPVPVEGASSNPSYRHAKKGGGRRQQQRKGTSHVIDVNSQLVEAIIQEKVSVVRRLISSGADPNTRSSKSTTQDPALVIACTVSSRESRLALARLLLDGGAGVDVENSVGQTALMLAAMDGDAGTCSLLLEAGASVTKEDCSRNTALSYAAESGVEDTLRMVVEAGKQQSFDIDHRNMKGQTPLLIACQKGHLATAQILVQEGGASPTIRDLDNFTTAGEWMRKSGLHSEAELKFLFPISRKKSYYRQRRQERGIKTLSDYLSSASESDTSVFSGRESKNKERNSFEISSVSKVSEHNGLSRSMFDIPVAASSSITAPPPGPPNSFRSPFRKKSILPRLPTKPKTSTIQESPNFKSELYQSRHLRQRQVYVAPNRQSGGYHSGALQPLPGHPLERISSERSSNSGQQLMTTYDGKKERTTAKKGKHKSLPPL